MFYEGIVPMSFLPRKLIATLAVASNTQYSDTVGSEHTIGENILIRVISLFQNRSIMKHVLKRKDISPVERFECPFPRPHSPPARPQHY